MFVALKSVYKWWRNHKLKTHDVSICTTDTGECYKICSTKKKKKKKKKKKLNKSYTKMWYVVRKSLHRASRVCGINICAEMVKKKNNTC